MKKRKISLSPTPRKRQRRNSHNAFIRMNNRVMSAIPHQHHTFMNIMRQYYEENPNVRHRYQRNQIQMPTRETMNAMARIYQTQRALLRRQTGPGATKNNAILII